MPHKPCEWSFLTFSVENQRFLWLQRIAEAKEPTKACPHTASWEPFHSKTTDSQCHPAGMSLFLSIYLFLYIYIFIYSYIFLTYVYIYIYVSLCISISTLRLFIRIVYKRTLPYQRYDAGKGCLKKGKISIPLFSGKGCQGCLATQV